MPVQENTNKAIAKNTLVLYIKLGVTSICGFLTTRFALQALGIVDYGLFSVLGSIITFIGILNTIMVSTTNRYIAVSLGKGDIKEANIQFNVCLAFHFVAAIITALIAYPLGAWYINNVLNYDGDIANAIFVFNVTVTASIFSFFAVPFSGVLTAKENFTNFAIPEIIGSILRLGVAYTLTLYFTHKLFIYSSFNAIYALYPPISYIIYCRKHYNPIVRFQLIKEKKYYKDIVSFSGWVAYGAVAYVGKAQGAAVLVNLFFSTIMNTALGIANTVNRLVGLLSRSASQSIDPQIMKSYTSGNRERSDYLLALSTKITFFVMFLVSVPFLTDCKWILSIWLKEVPEYAVIFTILLIIDNLVDSLNSGVKSIIFASGKIKLFQIIPSTLKLFSIIFAYIVLKAGAPPYALIEVYILFSIIVVVSNQIILKKTIHFDNKMLFRKSYLPSILIVILTLPIFFIKPFSMPLVRICVTLIYVCLLMVLIGMSRSERNMLYAFVTKKLFNKK